MMASEEELSALVAQYYRREIGILMHQAEHWAANGKPLAVHHRVFAADQCYQVVSLFEPRPGHTPAFDRIRSTLALGQMNPPGPYPPTIELHRYRDPRFVVEQLQSLQPKAK